ncbi:C3 and PZP-like alpha-2-macroglobulin domain-containing protein 8 isoform X2 [Lutzomyia longipalpis]|nr:C3 and PZP-like alpha-2-macroglobulin domain-containing protein 8 isoform X2 [Lutzomyia longipalpis]
MPIEVDTEDKLEYRFYPVTNRLVNFKIRAPNDAHLALTTGPAESDPMIEVFIGGWKNTKSVIRKNRTKPDVVEADTPDVLNAGEFRGFWIRWTMDGIITVGREGEAAAFLSWQDPDNCPFNYVGVCTGWGASGSWIIEDTPGGLVSSGGSACWVPASGGQVPDGAVPGGHDGEQLYVARARYGGGLIPGKLVPSHGVCYVPWGGGENSVTEYEVLCGGGSWVPGTGDAIPPNALPAGETEEGEPLFIGRANHEGTITVGKVQPSHGCVYIPYGGEELRYDQYEIFVQ